MDLCLNILRQVLSEYDENLLSTFDTVRHYAVDASAEQFAELEDRTPHQDDLEMAVNVIDAMNLHDAQLLARAFATYFHLANLCEENYRVSVLHERETNGRRRPRPSIRSTRSRWPTTSSSTRWARPRPRSCSTSLEFHPVFTAHPTEARRKAVEGKIRRISETARGAPSSAAPTRRMTAPSLQRDRRPVPHLSDCAEEADPG